ncbi:MAG: hypothetical protein ACRD13_01130 [Terriglobales bacterium]
MRTTLVLEDELVRRAKRRAADQNATLSQVVNAALRASLVHPVAAAAPLRLVTYGKGARRVRHEPADFARVQEREEREALRRR